MDTENKEFYSTFTGHLNFIPPLPRAVLGPWPLTSVSALILIVGFLSTRALVAWQLQQRGARGDSSPVFSDLFIWKCQ